MRRPPHQPMIGLGRKARTVNQIPTPISTNPLKRLTADPAILIGRSADERTVVTVNDAPNSNEAKTAAAAAYAATVIPGPTVKDCAVRPTSKAQFSQTLPGDSQSHKRHPHSPLTIPWTYQTSVRLFGRLRRAMTFEPSPDELVEVPGTQAMRPPAIEILDPAVSQIERSFQSRPLQPP